ncbi:MAG: hydantoinase B/oxoprolinase family protein, partial [Oleibacter sp.]|nr:hydantoinase B/oxoprolinase family protein [Thalassolituus sp.]
TTVATNALLERKGDNTLLLISKGLRDQLEIGYQTRPDIFAVCIEQPQPLYQRVYEVSERLLADGSVEQALDQDTTLVQLREAYKAGFRSIAVVLMHSYKYPQHELSIGKLAQDVGFTQISLSHQVSPLPKIVPRGDTTVADAYLSPILKRYIRQVETALAQLSERNTANTPPQLQFMQSNGGLTDAHQFYGKDAILSGPAGGVVGMSRSAVADGFENIIGFDMGGTSTDVSHYANDLERDTETIVNSVRLRVPMMKIHTVAAGGGSIVQFADGRLQVGPESAGAYPGPACYRNGGPLTVTDCNLVLGRLQATHFPAVFGPAHDQPLDVETVKAQFQQLVEQVSAVTGQVWSVEQLAEGFLTIAVETMAAAVKKISVQRGYDVQKYLLNAFGGAGGQHACALASALGMQRVYLHPLAGVLSAYGIGIAEQRELFELSVDAMLNDDALVSMSAAQSSLLARASFKTASHQKNDQQGPEYQTIWRAYLRYDGSDTPLLVSWTSPELALEQFAQQHKQLFGFCYSDKAVWIDALQLEVVSGGCELPRLSSDLNSNIATASEDSAGHHRREIKNQTAPLYVHGQWRDVPVLHRNDIGSDAQLCGPLLLCDANSTHVIEPGWQLRVLSSGALLLTKQKATDQQKPTDQQEAIDQQKSADPASNGPLDAANSSAQYDPIKLEIFNHLFMSVAEQMGFVLEKTASSVNIKERLDFSCALFDGAGELVANAPHIPVHLGSMSESIQVVMRDHPNMIAGDAFVLNTPYNGGTHLPDVTVVKPVFINPNQSSADFYVAARGHHADIGGITPGSMPAYSRHIDEEGVILDNLYLVRDGVFQQEEIIQALQSARYPARNPQQNIADLMAQLAACETGAKELIRLCANYGTDTVHGYMAHVQDNAEQMLRDCLATLEDGQFSYAMDDGSLFNVAIRVDQQDKTAEVDFTGTGYRPKQGQHPGNFNAPTSVVRAAVLYSFRLLVAKAIPLNAGFFRPLTITIPPASMIAPQHPAAVVSGNVETAQYLVDCLMGALGLMAGGQGTNNNFTFGNQTYQYYETICGGAGASRLGVGASAVHTHMTNSRLTDPEILEQRFPVVLDLFHIRQLSGGAGRFSGGNGVERHIRFLEPMQANIISGHRQVPTFSLNGAQCGQTGVNFVLRANNKADKRIEWLAGCADVAMNAGDTFCIHTPGGGGYEVNAIETDEIRP